MHNVTNVKSLTILFKSFIMKILLSLHPNFITNFLLMKNDHRINALSHCGLYGGITTDLLLNYAILLWYYNNLSIGTS